MMRKIMSHIPQVVVLTSLFLLSETVNMKCFYGERGSLTATCVNATPNFFRNTEYRFDYLDETLRCLNCQLIKIPESTFDISQNHIKYLDLKNSQISSISAGAFYGLIFMESLDLSHNTIKELMPEIFQGIKKLRMLDVSFNDISKLASNTFSGLPDLNTLTLSHNKLMCIESSSFNGPLSLLSLDLSYNEIIKLKEGAFSNRSAVTLNLSKNNLEYLSGTEFQNNTNLIKLDLSKNKLKSVNFQVFGENRLQTLDLSDNDIENFNYDDLNRLESLEVLNLEKNRVQEIGSTFSHLYNLEKLNLAFNNFKKVDLGNFLFLTRLQLLNFSNNQIDSVVITDDISLNHLYYLDLSENKLTDIEYTSLLAQLPKLSYLKMTGNNFDCNLKIELEEVTEDNVKFFFDELNTTKSKCFSNFTRNPNRKIKNEYCVRDSNENVRTAEIWIFVLISILILLIVLLFLSQYRVYTDLYKKNIERSSSTLQIISSNLEASD